MFALLFKINIYNRSQNSYKSIKFKDNKQLRNIFFCCFISFVAFLLMKYKENKKKLRHKPLTCKSNMCAHNKLYFSTIFIIEK